MLTATYRLQVHKDFPLAKVREVVPYLRELGISHLYLSPLLAARPGSTHGYDVVDPARVNPEVGTEGELRALAAEVHAAGMGIVLDIVPNHMGIGAENPYWEDVLTHGQQSRYARWFDIDWDAHPKRRGKVVLPVLGDELMAVLDKGELGLDISESGGVRLKYYDKTFPLDPVTVPPELQLVQFDPNAKQAAEEWVHGEEGKMRLLALVARQHYVLAFWRCAPSDVNYRRFFDVNDLAGLRTDDAAVFDETHAKILEWVRDGIVDGLRVDHVDGLRDPLGYLVRLREAVERRREEGGRRKEEGGMRRESAAPSPPSSFLIPPSSVLVPPSFPIYVEKILSPDEHLRREWPVQGTTGYETLNDIESIFIHYGGACAVERMYRRIRRLAVAGREVTFEGVAREGRLKVLRGALRADIRRLARLLAPVLSEARREEGGRRRETTALLAPPDSLTERALVDGLTQLVASLPVYRTYIDGRQPLPHPDDRAVLERAVARAEEHCNEIEHAVVQRIAEAFLEPLEEGGRRKEEGGRRKEEGEVGSTPSSFLPPHSSPRLEFILKFQQTSGPATAKGVEDTALYEYIPLASRNEVGGEPDRKLHDAVERFHAANAERARDWPLALVTTNTHDTKRSADLRARIDVLSEVPDEWDRYVTRWRRLNRRYKVAVKGRPSPDTNTEYLLYQTLVGLWPAPRANRRADDLPEREWFEGAAERLERYMMKAVKEAKTHTSWTDPDEEYEGSVSRFVHAILDREDNPEFLGDVARFVNAVARAGQWNAIARTLVHLTVPGTPDTYQGDELWNYTLVDPDNRRPVNYDHRLAFLADVTLNAKTPEARATLVRDLGRTPENPRLKLLIVRAALHTRRAMPALFREGEYVPLAATGAYADRVFAFARRHGGEAAITIVPRLVMPLLRGERKQVTGEAWGDTSLGLPAELAAHSWRSALTGREIGIDRGADGGELRLAGLFVDLPLDLLSASGGK
ncbi:MAG: malto-oligosyltrehalose synthase [Gemmatimonadota bacterium]|nr:malto-oligosyltrehalose synthase [Gemmatimonadota bacterium]